MLKRIVSGGQTGADQAGWRAAREAGLETGGWMPRGFLTEAGPKPEFAELYGAVESSAEAYVDRTRANVRDSDGTIWFGSVGSPGGGCTLDACRQCGKPHVIIPCERPPGRVVVASVASWVRNAKIATLNVAGNRESTSPGLGALVEAFIRELIRHMNDS